MESKGSRKSAANKLQSLAVQDQTIQSESRREAPETERNVSETTGSPRENVLPCSDSVVIRCGDRIVKGHLESPPWNSADDAVRSSPGQTYDVFRIRKLESNVIEEVPSSDISAVFFVNDFHGDPDRNTIRFHAEEPVLPGIWVQVQFPNGEVIEGIVENSIRFLVDPGFFLRPTDPCSNNKLVYVMKSALVEHHVLGLTKL